MNGIRPVINIIAMAEPKPVTIHANTTIAIQPKKPKCYFENNPIPADYLALILHNSRKDLNI